MTRHFISLNDLKKDELRSILDRSRAIKKNPDAFSGALRQKTLGLIFEKPSLRTHVSFRVAMYELGGESLYFGPADVQMEKREPVKDLARVMSSYLDGFVLRTFKHETIQEFARYSDRPVINGLSDFSHPAQILSDVFTMEEKLGDLKKRKIVYVGDGNNIVTSMLFAFSKLGFDLIYSTPKRFAPSAYVLRLAQLNAKKSGSKITTVWDPAKAVEGADAVYTDVWVSMGEEKIASEKKKHFKGFQVDSKLLKLAKKGAIFMHCLPAHRGEEVTDEVMESKNSVVFEQAANRLPVEKAILLYCIK
ncbi:MAG: ornithine carbamoyltransferase [Candidatus Omnitrophica bacterium]|nr:ornithine carbamoyltransferase [Candidatus Omnitrophota bacterium]